MNLSKAARDALVKAMGNCDFQVPLISFAVGHEIKNAGLCFYSCSPDAWVLTPAGVTVANLLAENARLREMAPVRALVEEWRGNARTAERMDADARYLEAEAYDACATRLQSAIAACESKGEEG